MRRKQGKSKEGAKKREREGSNSRERGQQTDQRGMGGREQARRAEERRGREGPDAAQACPGGRGGPEGVTPFEMQTLLLTLQTRMLSSWAGAAIRLPTSVSR